MIAFQSCLSNLLELKNVNLSNKTSFLRFFVCYINSEYRKCETDNKFKFQNYKWKSLIITGKWEANGFIQ